jgi:hypothetical protein
MKLVPELIGTVVVVVAAAVDVVELWTFHCYHPRLKTIHLY